MKKSTLIVSLTVAGLLGGCASALNPAGSSKFSCGGESPDCLTPIEVYQQTNTSPDGISNGHTPSNWKKGDGNGKVVQPLRKDLTQIDPSTKLLVYGDPPARPLRESSQVMRIWVAPWIDASDNLNWSGYIYTEVTPKKWSYGEQEVRHQGLPPGFSPQ
jgi:conjugal transfer pilus assembly protein TraV